MAGLRREHAEVLDETRVPDAATRRSRRRWLLPAVAGAMLTIGLAAGITIAANRDSKPTSNATVTATQLANVTQACRNWMNSSTSAGATPTLCDDMSGWIEPADDRQRPRDGLRNVGRSRPNARDMPYLDDVDDRWGHWSNARSMRPHGHLDATARRSQLERLDDERPGDGRLIPPTTHCCPTQTTKRGLSSGREATLNKSRCRPNDLTIDELTTHGNDSPDRSPQHRYECCAMSRCTTSTTTNASELDSVSLPAAFPITPRYDHVSTRGFSRALSSTARIPSSSLLSWRPREDSNLRPAI